MNNDLYIWYVLLAKSVNGDELAREVLTTLSTELGVTQCSLKHYFARKWRKKEKKEKIQPYR